MTEDQVVDIVSLVPCQHQFVRGIKVINGISLDASAVHITFLDGSERLFGFN